MTAVPAATRAPARLTPAQLALRRFRRSRAGVLSAWVLAALYLIALLAGSVNAADGNIEKIGMDERDGRISVVQLVVSVHDRVHLARVIKKLRALNGVIRITRMRA